MTPKELLDKHPYCFVGVPKLGKTGRLIGYPVDPDLYTYSKVPFSKAVILEREGASLNGNERGLNGKLQFFVLPDVKNGLYYNCEDILVIQHSHECKEKPISSLDFPHKCPVCKKACYIGFSKVEHQLGECRV